MNSTKSQFYFLVGLLIIFFVIAFFILKPFLDAVLLAVVFAAIFKPVYRRILKLVRERRGVASLITTIIVIICILTPIVFLGLQISKEAGQLYTTIANNSVKGGFVAYINNIVSHLLKYSPIVISFNLDQYLKEWSSYIIQNSGAVFSNLIGILTNIFIFLFSLFYFFKDGYKLKRTVINLSPLNDADDVAIFSKVEIAINSVIKGSISVALIQGMIITFGLTIFGVPNALLWGSLTVIAALIPTLGTSLVAIPSIIFLLLNNHFINAAGLTIWWLLLAVSLVDNVVGPRIVGRGTHLHPLIVFLSIIGGIAYFGVIGFLMGPLIISILFALLDIYSSLTVVENKN
jgi:predicted PurR-regulated permease PerM